MSRKLPAQYSEVSNILTYDRRLNKPCSQFKKRGGGGGGSDQNFTKQVNISS